MVVAQEEGTEEEAEGTEGSKEAATEGHQEEDTEGRQAVATEAEAAATDAKRLCLRPHTLVA
jgi:hypothetical protein